MKVYITGMGTVSSLGNTVPEMFSSLLENKTAVRRMEGWENYKGLNSYVGATVPQYDIMRVPRTARRTMSPMSEMATLATMEAIRQADVSIGNGQSTPRVLMCLGSTTGSPENFETYFKKIIERGGPEGQMGTTFFKVMNHSVNANVAAALGFKGAALSPSSACSTSAQSMIMGWELIQSGMYDIVIAGGADELHYTSTSVFDIVMAASRGYNDRPTETPRPFDVKRDGLVVAEGASVIVMESEASAKARGIRRLAEFCGGAYICDGAHMSQSNKFNMLDVMKATLERAKINAEDIQYVNAHATGTVQGDAEEAQAISEIFGKNVPVSSLKGHFGHSLAACGTLEVISSVQMMNEQVLIPTRNLTEIDPACTGIFHLQEKKSFPTTKVMSNNFAFGGMNTSLIIGASGD